MKFTARRCRHCGRPPCREACPVGAISRRADGIVIFSEELCIGCLLCEQACPDDCISIVADKRPSGKGKMAKSFIIDYERCCFCGLCVDPCPTTPITAIYMSHDYELSDYSRVEFITPKETLLNGCRIKRYDR